VYWEDGSQIVSPQDQDILKHVADVERYEDVKTMDKDKAVADGLFCMVPASVDENYYQALIKQTIHGDIIPKVADDIKIVYTPLHGTGNVPVREVLKRLGFKHVYVVEEQTVPDGDFSTVKSPNPEEPSAFAMGIDLAKKVNADVIMATDPDADRLGIYVKDSTGIWKDTEFADDPAFVKTLLNVKQTKKTEFKQYLQDKEGITIDDHSIFDVQVKRLHEYKRQQMNALYIIYKYMDIKAGNKPKTPITMIFGAKAAPAYTIAKDIIHLILCLSELISKDPEVSPYLKVVMLENYNVTYAEKVIPAADISEQISLASKEASGTGNMKFMLNGAITLGTEDGANVEIHQFVGDDNIYIFGESSEDVIALYDKAAYSAEKIYDADPEIAKLVDFIISKEMFAIGNKKSLIRLYMEIVTKDWFMTLLDLKDYIKVKEQALKDYEDRDAWAQKMIVNISKAGFFSSDRTIAQYNEDIWKLK